MVDKRIRDFTTTLTEGDLTVDDYVGVDQVAVGGSTGKLSILEQAKFIDKINLSKRVGSLSKDANSDLVFTTKYKSTYGDSIELQDKIEVIVDLAPSLTPFDWQNKLNPTLDVDGTGAKTIYNFKLFRISSNVYNNFDRNTIIAGRNKFIYDAGLDCWFWVPLSNVTSGELSICYTNSNLRAGFLRLNGFVLPNGATRLDYPNADTLGIFATDNQLIDMGDASLAGHSGNTRIDEVTDGQIENITGYVVLLDADAVPIWEETSGCFYGSSSTITTTNRIIFTPVGPSTTSQLNVDASRVVKTDKNNGSGTLTKRRGVYFYHKV